MKERAIILPLHREDTVHITLFGATGRVGSRFLEYALAGGHTVRAFVRHRDELTPRQGLDVVAGDVLDADAVSHAVRGADAVVSALGGAGIENPGTAISQGMRNIVAAMERHDVRRVLGVANQGILDSAKGGLRHEQPNFPAQFQAVTLEHRRAWEAMRASTLDWTMLALGDIVAGERTGVYRTLDNRLPNQAMQISVEDVADFLLRELGEGKHLRTRVGAGY